MTVDNNNIMPTVTVGPLRKQLVKNKIYKKQTMTVMPIRVKMMTVMMMMIIIQHRSTIFQLVAKTSMIVIYIHDFISIYLVLYC